MTHPLFQSSIRKRSHWDTTRQKMLPICLGYILPCKITCIEYPSHRFQIPKTKNRTQDSNKQPCLVIIVTTELV